MSLDVYSLAPNDPFFTLDYHSFEFNYWDKYDETRTMPLETTSKSFDLTPIKFILDGLKHNKLRLDVFSLLVWPNYSASDAMEGWVKVNGVERWRGMGEVDDDMFFYPNIEVETVDEIECGWQNPMDRTAQFAAAFIFTEKPNLDSTSSDVQYALLYKEFIPEVNETCIFLNCMTHTSSYLGENLILRRKTDGYTVWFPAVLWNITYGQAHNYYGYAMPPSHLKLWFPEWNETDWNVYGSVIASHLRESKPVLFWTVY